MPAAAAMATVVSDDYIHVARETSPFQHDRQIDHEEAGPDAVSSRYSVSSTTTEMTPAYMFIEWHPSCLPCFRSDSKNYRRCGARKTNTPYVYCSPKSTLKTRLQSTNVLQSALLGATVLLSHFTPNSSPRLGLDTNGVRPSTIMQEELVLPSPTTQSDRQTYSTFEHGVWIHHPQYLVRLYPRPSGLYGNKNRAPSWPNRHSLTSAVQHARRAPNTHEAHTVEQSLSNNLSICLPFYPPHPFTTKNGAHIYPIALRSEGGNQFHLAGALIHLEYYLSPLADIQPFQPRSSH